jgi:hypothetical protein
MPSQGLKALEAKIEELDALVRRWRIGSADEAAASALLGEIQSCTKAITSAETSARRRAASADGTPTAERAALQRLVATKNGTLHAFARALRARQVALAEVLGSQRQRLSALARAEAAPVDAREVVGYARKVRGTGFAPGGWDFNQPVRGFHLPSPQEEHMRRSVLWAGGGGGSGGSGSSTTAGGAAEATGSAVQSGPPPGWKPGDPIVLPAAAGPPPGWKPGDPIAMPAAAGPPPGWKPGDPIAMPAAAGPPPGWKPGDPIALPTAAEGVQKPRPAANAQLPAAPAPAPKAAPRSSGFSLDFSSSSSSSEDDSGSGGDSAPAAKRSKPN